MLKKMYMSLSINVNMVKNKLFFETQNYLVLNNLVFLKITLCTFCIHRKYLCLAMSFDTSSSNGCPK